jgi:hypothetical protein
MIRQGTAAHHALLTLKMLRWQAAGKMTETEMVRKEPMRDMT